MSVSREIDASTLRRITQGDVAAARALIELYQDRVVALCCGVAGNRDELAAHDVALDVFLRIFDYLKKLPQLGPARLSTWILTIAAQRAVAAHLEHAGNAARPSDEVREPTLEAAPAEPCPLDVSAADHVALLALPAHVLAARAWAELNATPGFSDRVLAAVVHASALSAASTHASAAPVGLFESASARRISVIIAVAALAAFAIAMLRSGGVPAQHRPTPAEMVSKGSAATLPLLPSTGQGLEAAQSPDVAAMRARDQAQQAEIAALKAQVAQLQAEIDSTKTVEEDTGYPHPRPEVLRRWAAECHTRFDNLDVSQESPLQVTGDNFGLTPAEIPGFNAAMREVHANWLVVVRAAYFEITGDAVGTKVLSPTAMISEMNHKGAKNEINALRARIANERAGLVAAPAADAEMSALERHYRAYANLGDTIETALAKRIGAPRARAVRGNGWNHQSESTGCP